MSASQPCEDFLEFQESIKKLRAVDDNIIYTLNTSLPTESFKGQVNCEKVCTNLFNQLKEVHRKRENKINDCILISAESLKQLRELRDNSPDDVEIDKKFKSEQRKLRLLQSEVNVEDIVNERSLEPHDGLLIKFSYFKF
ncbi:unnamed protein product [Ceratitis capitata]|uniref:Protein MIX23 n=1 Tax=Ceratitis capitata TaxID=7213 RepID=A0A811V0E1_CERCA|nr:unnamed protein product [Ceratitis capitata]